MNLHKILEGFSDKSAEAVCIFAYCEGPEHEPLLFEGRIKVREYVVAKSSRLTYKTPRDASYLDEAERDLVSSLLQ